jgi:hypothetical protein
MYEELEEGGERMSKWGKLWPCVQVTVIFKSLELGTLGLIVESNWNVKENIRVRKYYGDIGDASVTVAARRRRSAAARLLRLWFRIPPGAWMFVCCECCVLSGRGLCDGLITSPEESYQLWCVVVCDLETS